MNRKRMTKAQLEKQIEYLGWIYEGKVRRHNSMLLHTQISIVGAFMLLVMSWSLGSSIGFYGAIGVVMWVTVGNSRRRKPLVIDLERLSAKINLNYEELLGSKD